MVKYTRNLVAVLTAVVGISFTVPAAAIPQIDITVGGSTVSATAIRVGYAQSGTVEFAVP